MTKKIAILYFCSWSYQRYWSDFYKTSEKFFLQNTDKHYFVWTDDKNVQGDNVTCFYQESLWWPKHTLYRFRMFLWIQNTLSQYDYIVFFNANVKFVANINEENFLPSDWQKYMALEHFSYYNTSVEKFPYDRNPLSKAYIPYGEWQHYFLGFLNGWISKDYLQLCKTCDTWIREDEEKNIFPLWFDESILNKFLLNRTDIRVLDVSYWYPEAWWFPKFIPKILSLSKEIYVGSKDKFRKWGEQRIHVWKWLFVKGIMLWKKIFYSITGHFSKINKLNNHD